MGVWAKVDGVDTVDGSGRSHRKAEREDVHYVDSVHYVHYVEPVHSVHFRRYAHTPIRLLLTPLHESASRLVLRSHSLNPGTPSMSASQARRAPRVAHLAKEEAGRAPDLMALYLPREQGQPEQPSS
jgi:hypothetical protein